MENPRRSICTWKIGWIVVFVLIVHVLPDRDGGNHNNENYCLLDSIYQAVKDEYCNGNSGNSCEDEYCNGNSGNSCEETCCQDDTDKKCEECCKDVFENLQETCCQDNTDNKCEGLVDDCFKKKHNGTNTSNQQANKIKRKCLNKILPCLALMYKGTSETGTELISYGKRQFPRNETIKLISYSSSIEERTSDDQNADLEVILPAELTERAAENQNDLSGLSFHVFKDTDLFEDEKNSTLLNQQVFGITVGNSSFQNLKEGVSIKVNHSVATPNGYVHRCVFWFESEDENITDSWNSTGCNTTVEGNQTICVCNHLTYFAVLMDPRADTVILDQTDLTSLTYISKIGCGISAFFVAITVFVHCVIRKNQGDHTNKIHINLCIACFLLNVNFLTNEWLSKLAIDGLCKTIAVFLHYSLLSTFAWMAIEGFHLYLMLVKVFNIHVRHYIYKLAFMGWGIPAVVVFVCVGVNQDNYGTFEIHTLDTNSSVSMCWIKNKTIHYVTNCGFFGLIWLMNLAMMITVCTKLTQMRNNTHSGSRPVCKDLWAILGLSVLLGMTWCLAFFSFGAQVVQMYLFCILNCLQGFFIFLWYCAVKRSDNEQSTNYTSDK